MSLSRALPCLILALVLGCGGGPSEPRPVPISGEVQLDEKEMLEGKIRFIEAGVPPVEMTVKDGKFTGKVKPGNYRVEIGVYVKAVLPPDFPMQGVDPGVKNILPERFNINSKLTAEVKADAANEFKFKVESK